jgi:hypothetical protein
MPFCYCPKNYVSKVVSIRRRKTIAKEEANKPTIRG